MLGTHLELPGMHYRKTRAWVLEPEGWGRGMDDPNQTLQKKTMTKDQLQKGYVDVSGEEIEYGPIRVEVHSDIIR